MGLVQLKHLKKCFDRFTYILGLIALLGVIWVVQAFLTYEPKWQLELPPGSKVIQSNIAGFHNLLELSIWREVLLPEPKGCAVVFDQADFIEESVEAGNHLPEQYDYRIYTKNYYHESNDRDYICFETSDLRRIILVEWST